jgi:hypothetical protein
MRNRFVIAAASLLTVGALVGSAVPASAHHRSDHRIAFGVVRMDGAQEVSPDGQLGAGDADGKGIFAYLAFDGRLCYFMTARKIEPAAAAHIHQAPRGANGGIVIGLTAPTEGFSADCIAAQPDTVENTPDVLTQSELDAIIANPADYYANVHNAPFPGGAIRGQLR